MSDAQTPKPILIIGGGGHAKVLLDALIASGKEVIGFLDSNPEKEYLLGYKRLGGDEQLSSFEPDHIQLVNGLGSVGLPGARLEKYKTLKSRNFKFASVVHPSAIVSAEVSLGEGVQIMAGAVIQAGTILGENTIVNTKASVDHDADIRSHVHIAPGATLSGTVKVGRESHIGTGATIIHGITIAERCVVGAGAVVIRDVPKGATVAGVPARPF